MTSSFADIVPPFHRQRNCIRSAAIGGHGFGDWPSFWKAVCPNFPPFRHTCPDDSTWLKIFPAYQSVEKVAFFSISGRGWNYWDKGGTTVVRGEAYNHVGAMGRHHQQNPAECPDRRLFRGACADQLAPQQRQVVAGDMERGAHVDIGDALPRRSSTHSSFDCFLPLRPQSRRVGFLAVGVSIPLAAASGRSASP